jgi:hypothetical protein
MNKILLGLVLASISMALIAPVMVSAQPAVIGTAPTACTPRRAVAFTGLTCPAANTNCPYDSAAFDCAMCCVVATIWWITDWLFMIVMIIVIILILVGAFTLITAGGSEEGVRKGRNYIVFAMIGVAVALLAKAIPYIVATIISV